MEDLKIEETKKWIQTWQIAGNSLEDIRIKELRDPDYYSRNLPLLNEMLKYAFNHRIDKLSSGLIKQQQIFMKYYHKVG
jgi:hypothetical protein